jgi:guanylate kinase
MQTIGNIFVISAPSGAGKSSLVKALCNLDPKIKVSISHTTRLIRAGETEGLEYHFISTETFKKMIEEKSFIEFAKVYDNYYGTSIAMVNKIINSGYDLILEIDHQGALQIKELFLDARLIYILPPSKEELSKRLNNRKTDSMDVINKRLALAAEDISYAHHFDFAVINDDFNIALHDIYSIIRSSRFEANKVLKNYKF